MKAGHILAAYPTVLTFSCAPTPEPAPSRKFAPSVEITRDEWFALCNPEPVIDDETQPIFDDEVPFDFEP